MLQERLASGQPPRPWVQGGSTVPPGGQLKPRQEEPGLITPLVWVWKKDARGLKLHQQKVLKDLGSLGLTLQPSSI